MVQPLNNGVTADPGSRYSIRDGAYGRDRERRSRTMQILKAVSPPEEG